MEIETNHEELIVIYKKVNTIRHANKTIDSYSEAYLYIKCFFDLLNIKFPSDLSIKSIISSGKYPLEILKLIYSMIDELIILGYHMNYKDLCLLLSDRTILSPGSLINKDQAIGNQRFYINKLEIIKSGKIVLNTKLENYLPMNPSILNTKDGYIINCRMVNYELTQNGLYIIKHPQMRIVTNNIILVTNKKFEIISERLISDKSKSIKLSNPNIEGFEDLILFQKKDDIYFTCTTLDTNQHGRPQITLCKLNNDYEIIEKIPFESPQNRQEKNWLPFISEDGNFNVIYEYNPYTIIKIHEHISQSELSESKTEKEVSMLVKLEKNKSINYNLNFSRFKGSAAPIPFDSGYLIIIHETFNLTPSLRCYLHRFIQLDKSMEIIKLSHPWYFENHGIEFCRSMCHSHTENRIILTYSIHDKDAQWCEISSDYIRGLLKDLNEFIF